jgi:DNA (cytosine-5)-methyltransferase 1
VIENVPGAPLINPVMLCGAALGLKTYRHRLFESNFPLKAPYHPPHRIRAERTDRTPKNGEFLSVAGHFPCVDQVRKDWGVEWMARDEISECIPPAYSRYIADQFKLSAAPSSGEKDGTR